MLKAVIFDMDGLILDTERLSLRCWKKACAERGYEMTEEVFSLAIGRRVVETEEKWKTIFGADFPFVELRARRLELAAQDIKQNGMPVKPGLDPLLEFLTQHQTIIAVATSTVLSEAKERLAQAGLLEKFPLIISGDQVKHGKPAPDIFLLAAEVLSVDPNSCLVLEDSLLGAEAALAAGMQAIIIPDLQEPDQALRSRVLAVLNSLDQVPQVISALI